MSRVRYSRRNLLERCAVFGALVTLPAFDVASVSVQVAISHAKNLENFPAAKIRLSISQFHLTIHTGLEPVPSVRRLESPAFVEWESKVSKIDVANGNGLRYGGKGCTGLRHCAAHQEEHGQDVARR